jgi:hypothetical protein
LRVRRHSLTADENDIDFEHSADSKMRIRNKD